MTISDIKTQIPDYAKDIRLNLSNVLGESGSPGLTESQRWGTALACAHACGVPQLVDMVLTEAGDVIDAALENAAKGASAIMGMNNIYYRFLHLSSNAEYAQLPARLRMTIIGNPGVDKVDFELFSLAVSAINGCGMCIDSHEKVLQQAEVKSAAVQDAVRIASVLHAAAAILKVENPSD